MVKKNSLQIRRVRGSAGLGTAMFLLAVLLLSSSLFAQGAPKKISHFNDAWQQFALIKPEIYKYKSFDGIEIEAALLKPAGYDGKSKLPLIAQIHGGPTGNWEDSIDIFCINRVFPQPARSLQKNCCGKVKIPLPTLSRCPWACQLRNVETRPASSRVSRSCCIMLPAELLGGDCGCALWEGGRSVFGLLVNCFAVPLCRRLPPTSREARCPS